MIESAITVDFTETTGRSPIPSGQLRLAGIVEDSIVDGPGLRLAVFAQGCPHRCRGCHNPQTHSYTSGMMVDIETIVERYHRNPLLDGVTLSGGEPFEQAEGFALLARRIRELGGHVVTYTGYTYETIVAKMEIRTGWKALLEATDWLIDGPFIEKRRNLALSFRGSDNQRIIDVPQSLLQPSNNPVLCRV